MLREKILKKFETLTQEEKIAEYQKYKVLGENGPLTESDLKIMAEIIAKPNKQIDLVCENGVCYIKTDEQEITESKHSETKEVVLISDSKKKILSKSNQQL